MPHSKINSGKRLLILALLAFCIQNVKAQVGGSTENIQKSPVIPPSPESSSLGKYVDIPISYYTGTPNVDIPITNITVGELNVPVSLKYRSSGNKVQDVANKTGLGWTLDAGGIVTRSVRGLPDDGLGGLSFFSLIENIEYEELIESSTPNVVDLYWQPASMNCLDTQPDLYYFNFNGITGSFTFDWNGNIMINEGAKIKISPIKDPATGKILGWDFITDKGVKYNFEALEYSQIVTGVGLCDATLRYVSTWHLSKISDVNEFNHIYFDYENYRLDYETTTSETQQHAHELPGGVLDFNEGAYEKNGYTMWIDGKNLKSITTSNNLFQVDFNYINTRNDVSGTNLKSLDEIVLKKLFDGSESTFNLNYDYTKSRLLLTSVGESSGTLSNPTYDFFYNTTELPLVTSNAIDHWGYYNSNTANTLIPSAWVDYLSGESVFWEGANRESDPSKMQAMILNKIIYPTGGIREFEWEPHKYAFNQMGYLGDQGLFATTTFSNEVNINGNTIYPNGTAVPVKQSFNFEIPQTLDAEGNLVSQTVSLKISRTISWFTENYFGLGKYPKVYIEDENGNSVYSKSATGEDTDYIKLPSGNYTAYAEATWKDTPSNGGKMDFARISVRYDYLDYTRPVTEELVSGIRIKEIRDYSYESDPNYKITRFDYKLSDGRSSGVIYKKPVYQTIKERYITNANQEIDYKILLRYSKNQILLGQTRGSHIGYKKVTVSYGNNNDIGYTEFNYTTPDVFPDIIYDTPPFAPNTSNAYKTGLLLEKSVFDKNGKISLKEGYNYNYTNSFVPSFQIEYKGGENNHFDWKYDVRLYSNEFGHPQIVNKTTYTYSTETNEYLSTVESFEYDANLQNLLKTSMQLNIDEKEVTEIRYANTNVSYFSESLSTNALEAKTKMLERNMISIPLEKVTTRLKLTTLEEKPVSKQRDNYTVQDNKLFKYNEEESLNNNPYHETNVYKYDSENGKLIEFTKENDVVQSFIWGYKNSFPIADVMNANANEVYYNGFEEDINALYNDSKTGRKSFNGSFKVEGSELITGEYILSYWKKSGSEWEYIEQEIIHNGNDIIVPGLIDDLRIYPKNAKMTNYTYIPHVGMTSKSDPNSVISYYEYDALGRLILIRNYNKDIIKKYEYNFGK